ncbi:MAG: hypothetical protein LBR36_06670 [Bacteroidales bacterium]|jgi:bacteriocin-like protein|nr:hypothetical protein [Bacteroidales bacterium]
MYSKELTKKELDVIKGGLSVGSDAVFYDGTSDMLGMADAEFAKNNINKLPKCTCTFKNFDRMLNTNKAWGCVCTCA